MSGDQPPPTVSDLLKQAVAAGDPELADRAVALLRAVRPANPIAHAANLGVALLVRYDLTGDTEALRESVDLYRSAVDARPDDSRSRTNLGLALYRTFEHHEDVDALTEAVVHLREAVALVAEDDPRRTSYLANHGLALLGLAEHTGRDAPAEEAVTVRRQAAAAERDPAARAAMLSNVSAALMLRFRITADPRHLREAVAASQEAVRTVPVEHAFARGCLAGLGDALAASASFYADPAAAVAAIETLQTSVYRLRPDDPDAPLFLMQLAEALRGSYALTGDTQALDASITARRDALQRTPESHAQRVSRQADLAMALRNRFEAHHDTADLHEARALLDRVLSTAGEQHVEWQKWQGDMAHVLHRLGIADRDPGPLAEAAGRLGAAVAATGLDHRDAVMHRINLGGVLVSIIELRWDEAMYDRAVATMSEALAISATGTPTWAELHLNLGLAHAARCRHAWSRAAYQDGTDAFGQALHTPTAPAGIRLAAGRHLARLQEHGGHTAAALDTYSTALDLLDLAAWQGLRHDDQERTLALYGGLGRSAAACAVAHGDAGRAITMSEQGRAILLGRALDRRSRHRQLSAREPDLERELRDVLDAIESAPAGIPLLERQRLELRRAAVVDRIRSRPGFTRFLLRPDADQLLRGVHDATVVTVNVAPTRCDALIAANGDLDVVHLPDLTQDECTSRLQSFAQAVSANTWQTNEVLSQTLAWLWNAAVGPIVAALRLHGPDAHVRWIPTGPLSLLPMHAAGRYDDAAQPAALDQMVSSYLPAIRPLTAHGTDGSIHGVPGAHRPGSTLVVGVDTEAMPLPAMIAETAMAGARATLPVVSLTGAAATRAAVLAELPAAGRLHLACHAVTDPRHPSDSHLQFADDVLRVREIGASRSTGGDLAYLSACQTAAGSPGLADEAIHIASAFQLAGFEHVIGTLWRVSDRAALDVATAFYTALAVAPPHQALSIAVRQHRQRYPSSPSEWAAFVHYGSLT
ncbi:CHAT domain-containing protein [Dactylosporangium sp. NBC_01737]|uniref:CHAT domain-containing protein n=1 Tax=Dactylosporangium sp. NBC_01737 TaxID=2975959 RepID=UPI002E1661BF|nr:CHAT domain-containing protein [Dactylosporangium sp. NBC_01737]